MRQVNISTKYGQVTKQHVIFSRVLIRVAHRKQLDYEGFLVDLEHAAVMKMKDEMAVELQSQRQRYKVYVTVIRIYTDLTTSCHFIT